MPFITQGKTNWKYILIIVILAFFVGGGIFGYRYWWQPREEIKNECKKEFIFWCENCRSLNWPLGIAGSPILSTKTVKCLGDYFLKSPLPKTNYCYDTRNFCKDFGIEFGVSEEKEVSIATDKTEYEQGKGIKITLRNNLDKSIYFGKETISAEDIIPLGFSLEKFEKEEWKKIQTSHPIADGLSPGVKLKPNENFEFSWNQEFFVILSPTQAEKNKVSPGKYRICLRFSLMEGNNYESICSKEFTIKEKIQDETANWKTYRNEEYEFEIKYPDFLFVKTEKKEFINKGKRESQFFINFCFPTELWPEGYSVELTLNIISNQEKQLLREWIVARYGVPEDFPFTEIDTEHNIQALKPEVVTEDYRKKLTPSQEAGYMNLIHEYWFVGNQDYIFSLSPRWFDSSLSMSELQKIAYQMLSTFRFLE